MSVSSRRAKVKRNSDSASWRQKLDEGGTQYLETYRQQKLETQAEERKQRPVDLLDRLVAMVSGTTKQPEEYSKYLNDLRAQNPDAADKFESAVRAAMMQYASYPTKELWKIIAFTLENAGRQGRQAIAFLLAILVHVGLGTYKDIRQRHFGNVEIPPREFYWVMGTTLQEIGAIFRGNSRPATKGRVNTELLDIIRKIREHEKNKLTYRELKDALEYVLIYQDEDALKLFVHRAKKRKWL